LYGSCTKSSSLISTGFESLPAELAEIMLDSSLVFPLEVETRELDSNCWVEELDERLIVEEHRLGLFLDRMTKTPVDIEPLTLDEIENMDGPSEKEPFDGLNEVYDERGESRDIQVLNTTVSSDNDLLQDLASTSTPDSYSNKDGGDMWSDVFLETPLTTSISQVILQTDKAKDSTLELMSHTEEGEIQLEPPEQEVRLVQWSIGRIDWMTEDRAWLILITTIYLLLIWYD